MGPVESRIDYERWCGAAKRVGYRYTPEKREKLYVKTQPVYYTYTQSRQLYGMTQRECKRKQ